MKPGTLIRMALTAPIALLIAAVAGGWEVRVNGRPGSDSDDATSVAVDTVTGSIFVAGRRQISSRDSQFFLRKLAADGTREWQETGDDAEAGPAAGAVAVAVDSNGFVFVGGEINNGDSGGDFLIMKMDGRSSRRHVVWKRVVDGRGYADQMNAMTLTPDGGVVIAGMVGIGSGAYNFYIMKFTSEGRDAWQSPQVISGTGRSGLNYATAVGILPNGDVAATGRLDNAAGTDSILGRFDGTTGEPRWLLTLTNADATALSITANGDIVAGVRAARRDFSVYRFNQAGVLLWRTIFSDGTVRTVSSAPDGDVIAAGDLTHSRFFVVSLSPDGGERWRYESPGTTYKYGARSIAFDHAGNPIITGASEEGSRTLSTFTVVALNKATGMVLWDVPITGTTPFGNEGHAVVSNVTTGAIVAVGVTQNVRSSVDITITSIRDGYEEWRQVITGNGKRIDRDDATLAVAVDPARNTLALAGYTQNTATGLWGTPHEFRVVKIRNNGTVAWKYDLNDPVPHLENAAMAIAVDPSGDFFSAGRTCSMLPVSCFTVIRVSKNGKEVWRAIVPGIPGRNEARAITRDPHDGNLIVAGLVQTSAGGAFAVFKLDANSGSILWPTAISDFPLGHANAVTLTSRNTVAVAGSVAGSFAVLEFDTSTGTIVSRGIFPDASEAGSVAFDEPDGAIVAGGSGRTVTEGPFRPMVVAKFDRNGTVIWAKSFQTGSATVAVQQETGAIAVGNTSSFTAMLLDSNGTEKWRNDTPGAQSTVAFLTDSVIAVGQIGAGSSADLTVVAFAEDGTERWRRTLGSTQLYSATALAVDDTKKSLFAAGQLISGPTWRDMFAVGLSIDGSDLSGFASLSTMANAVRSSNFSIASQPRTRSPE
jgi:hypothetical protein